MGSHQQACARVFACRRLLCSTAFLLSGLRNFMQWAIDKAEGIFRTNMGQTFATSNRAASNAPAGPMGGTDTDLVRAAREVSTFRCCSLAPPVFPGLCRRTFG